MESSNMQHQPEANGADGRRLSRLTSTPNIPPPSPPTAPAESNAESGVIPRRLKDALEDAELLLAYAAEAGVDIDRDLRARVLAARRAATGGWNDQYALDLLGALTTLSARMKPVSGESLRLCEGEALKTISRLRSVAILLAVIIVPCSMVAFVASATCESIRQQIELANGLAVTLIRLPTPSAPTDGAVAGGGDVGRYPESVAKQLQQFAATIRDIDRKANQLKWLTFLPINDPLKSRRWNKDEVRALFELPSTGLFVAAEVAKRINLYQDVRAFAQSTEEMVLISFGAFTSCVLPLLYALLGACAFQIRSFVEQRRKRTFSVQGQRPARLVIAAICGLVIGLFGNFGEGHAVGLSPLAVAFMVGYAVDLFFQYIDGLLRALARQPAETEARGSAKPPQQPAV
ncbi:MAG TPA: hypothetical protein VMU50_11030 [Polyangia bacterium]|nr:hypothetical protein [Polyangia bacterium]